MTQRDESAAEGRMEAFDLHSFVDGRLFGEQRRQVAARAAANDEESSRIAAYERQNALFAQIREGLGDMRSESFAANLQQDLRDVLDRNRRRRRFCVRLLGAAAATLLLFAAGWSHIADRMAPAPVRQADGPLFPFGGSFVVPAGTTPSGTVEESLAWLGQHMTAERFQLVDLETVGLELVGGGIVSDSGSPAVHLVFLDQDQNPISLYVGVLSRSVRAAFTMVPEGHISLHWRHGRLIFALVGQVDSPRLLEIMQEISAGVVQNGNGSTPSRPQIEPAPADNAAASSVQTILLPADVSTSGAAPVLPNGDSFLPAPQPVVPLAVPPQQEAEAKAL
jgi:anti-sigma factor RsiW